MAYRLLKPLLLILLLTSWVGPAFAHSDPTSITGALINSGEGKLELSTGRLKLAHLKDSDRYDHKSGGVSGFAGGSYRQSRSSASGTTYTGALVSAGERLSATTGRDLTVRGGILEGRVAEVNVGGNLFLQSLQDASRSRSSSFSVSFGKDLLPSSFSVSSEKSESLWTHTLAGIYGERGATVTVSGTTRLIGAAIDGGEGETHLTTASLSHRELRDFERASGFNFSISGLDKLLRKSLANNGAGSGAGSGYVSPFKSELSIGAHSKIKEGITYSVVGRGAIKLTDPKADQSVIATLKRDISGQQVVTVDHESGFQITLPLVDFEELASVSRDITHFVNAISSPVPAEIAGAGPNAEKALRLSLSGAFGEKGLSPEEITEAAAQADQWLAALQHYSGFENIPAEIAELILAGEAIDYSSGTAKVIISCGVGSVMCPLLGVVVGGGAVGEAVAAAGAIAVIVAKGLQDGHISPGAVAFRIAVLPQILLNQSRDGEGKKSAVNQGTGSNNTTTGYIPPGGPDDDGNWEPDDRNPSGNQNRKFEDQYRERGEKSLRRSYRSLEKEVSKHQQKLKDEPNSVDANHWKKEIRNFRKEQTAIRRVLKQNGGSL